MQEEHHRLDCKYICSFLVPSISLPSPLSQPTTACPPNSRSVGGIASIPHQTRRPAYDPTFSLSQGGLQQSIYEALTREELQSEARRLRAAFFRERALAQLHSDHAQEV